MTLAAVSTPYLCATRHTSVSKRDLSTNSLSRLLRLALARWPRLPTSGERRKVRLPTDVFPAPAVPCEPRVKTGPPD